METVTTLLFNFVMGFVNLLLLPWHIFQWLTLETLKAKMSALTLAGMSQEFFFVVTAFVILLIGLGIYKRSILRGTVSILEQFNGRIGRFSCVVCIVDDASTGDDYRYGANFSRQ